LKASAYGKKRDAAGDSFADEREGEIIALLV
jgi:hypothetical protein